MDERVKWAEMKPYEQDELVHEHVMHGKCPCHALPGVGYIPNAYYVWECGKCKANNTTSSGTYRDHDSQVLPQYSRTWDAAWEVFLHMMQTYYPTRDEWQGPHYPIFRTFADTLVWFDDRPMAVYGDEIYPAEYFFEIVAKWTPENICKAALRAMGVEIDDK